nr:MAG TPA: hypothetical protein [Caudoviricetes sp.]
MTTYTGHSKLIDIREQQLRQTALPLHSQKD